MTDSGVHVLSDANAVATEVAGRFLRTVAQAQAERGTAHVVLTGGTIADLVHREIASGAAASGVDWARVVLWWGDERIVSEHSDERNELQTRRALLDHVYVPESNIRAIPSSEVGDVHQVAGRYAHMLEDAPDEFDLVMLGIGPDGHVASLFPGHPQIDAPGVAVGVTDSPKPPPARVSMTFDRLNATRETWVMASGEGKAEAVAAAMRDGDASEIPARGVSPRGRVHWFLDEAAAARR